MTSASVDNRRMPEFVIIGAAKAATTWIVHQLQHHPDVFLPGPEPHYFSREYAQGADWYAQWFAPAGTRQVVGEKSADYLAHESAAERMGRDIPEARIVVQLRNPVERAYSDYCMLFRRGSVGSTPEDYLRPGAAVPRFVEDGFYFRHLQRFLDHFSREQILVLLHEDIRQRPEEVIRRVSSHIGVEPRIAGAQVSARVNDGQAALLPLPLRRALAPLKETVAPLRTKAWFRAVHGLLARPPEYPPLTPSLRRQLGDIYAEDVDQLSQLLRRDLGMWLSTRLEAA